MIDGLPIAQFELMVMGGLAAIALYTLIVCRPQFGAYLYLAASPLIVGVARGHLMPVLRPNEALLLLIIAALATRASLAMLARSYVVPSITIVDVAVLLLAAASSILPLLQRLVRDLPVSSDDLLYSAVLWKYFLLFRMIRASVSTPSQVRRSLWLAMASAAIAAIIGMLQVGNLFGVPAFLHRYFDQPFEGNTGVVIYRATSTVASSFGFADLMIMNFVLALALHREKPRVRWLVTGASVLFFCGCITSGEFSAVIGLAVALVTFGVASGRLGFVLRTGALSALAASILFWPVIAKRMAGFSQSSFLPTSWLGRWTNLRRFFFPELFSNFNWILGVRPAPRIPAPESWRDWVYIESGYVWLLWIGGIPLFAAFLFFLWVSARTLWQVVRNRTDATRAAAMACLAYLTAVTVLMLFDPHLTLRGSADFFFPLLGLSLVRPPSTQRVIRHAGISLLSRAPAIIAMLRLEPQEHGPAGIG